MYPRGNCNTYNNTSDDTNYGALDAANPTYHKLPHHPPNHIPFQPLSQPRFVTPALWNETVASSPLKPSRRRLSQPRRRLPTHPPPPPTSSLDGQLPLLVVGFRNAQSPSRPISFAVVDCCRISCPRHDQSPLLVDSTPGTPNFEITTNPRKLFEELNKGEVGGDKETELNRTSLGEHVKNFRSSFLQPLLKSCKKHHVS